MSPTIETASGREFNFLAPSPESIDIDDIAHALSHLCRYTGHVRQFYSVAQHSYIVSRMCSPEAAMYGLLHDASEAYLGDVSSPLKQLLQDYRHLESIVQEAIYRRFNLHPCEPSEVKSNDLRALVTEKRDLMSDSWRLWGDFSHIKPRERPISPLPPQLAKNMFLNRFHELRVSQRQARTTA